MDVKINEWYINVTKKSWLKKAKKNKSSHWTVQVNVFKRKVMAVPLPLKRRFTACCIVLVARCSKFVNMISAKMNGNTANYQQHMLLTKQIWVKDSFKEKARAYWLFHMHADQNMCKNTWYNKWYENKNGFRFGHTTLFARYVTNKMKIQLLRL